MPPEVGTAHIEKLVVQSHAACHTTHSSFSPSGKMEDILKVITAMRPPLRLCAISKQQGEQCGFHLSRSHWDPYPWISNVEEDSPAAKAGLTIGDFVIEVNGEDILGLRIEEVAQKVRLKGDAVRLLVWKAAIPETEVKFPTVFHVQKFSLFLQSALQLIECPVCLESASSPTFQCVNGHILCVKCTIKTTKCPMCRVPLSGKGRCLVVDKLRALIIKTLAIGSQELTNEENSPSNSKLSATAPSKTDATNEVPKRRPRTMSLPLSSTSNDSEVVQPQHT